MSNNERFTIKTYTNPSGQQVWRVEGRMPDGERVRQNFSEKADALARKAELEIEALNRPGGVGFKQTRLTDEQLTQAEAAFLKLDGQPLVAAVDFYLSHARPKGVEITIKKAVDGFLEANQTQKKLRPRTRKDYLSRTAPLVELYPERPLSSISRAEQESIIFKPGQSACTANGNRRVLNTFFTWCVDQEYAQVNPVSKIATAERDDKEPEIMTLPEVKLLLRAAVTVKDGKMLPYVVLGLFMGLRPEEIARLQWKHVDLEQRLIRIQGDVAKLRHRRVIEIPGNAVEWLRVFHGKPIIVFTTQRQQARDGFNARPVRSRIQTALETAHSSFQLSCRYRPGKSGHDAVRAVHSWLNRGHRQVVDADLSGYYDSIPHHGLLKCVARRVSDGAMLALIQLWLENPVEETVILCRGSAEEARVRMQKIMEVLKLQVNEVKTKTCHVPEESFDFLGYTIGWQYSTRNGRGYIGTRPSKKRINRFCEAISLMLAPDTTYTSAEEKVQDLNRKLRGWANYFCLSAVSKAYKAVQRHTCYRLRQWLRRKHKTGRSGNRTYWEKYFYERLGLLDITKLTPTFPWAKSADS